LAWHHTAPPQENNIKRWLRMTSMLTSWLCNPHHAMHNFATSVLKETQGGTKDDQNMMLCALQT
jgi:hypothetical protein